MEINIKAFTGEDAYAYKADLARLRIQVFREYPYLYDGTLAYEEDYLDILTLKWFGSTDAAVGTGPKLL